MVGLLLEVRAVHPAPAALGADPTRVLQPRLVHPLARLVVGRRDVTVGVIADRLRPLAQLLERAAVQFGERGEPLDGAADDRQHQGQVVGGGADHRLRRPADRDPRLQWAVGQFRVEFDVVEALRQRPLPRVRTALDQLREQLEFLLEQRLVVLQVIAEQRERLDERAAADDDLRATAADRVERREPLEDADRVVGGQHRDGGRELDPRRARRDRRQHHVGGGDREVVAVVLPDADGVEAELVRQDRLVDHVADDHIVGEQPAVGVLGDVAEGVDAELDVHDPS